LRFSERIKFFWEGGLPVRVGRHGRGMEIWEGPSTRDGGREEGGRRKRGGREREEEGGGTYHVVKGPQPGIRHRLITKKEKVNLSGKILFLQKNFKLLFEKSTFLTKLYKKCIFLKKIPIGLTLTANEIHAQRRQSHSCDT
jgi:hypothetical protein